MTPHVLVRVRFFTTAEGGRTSRVFSPYRAPATFEELDRKAMYDVELQFAELDVVDLGVPGPRPPDPGLSRVWPARVCGERIRIHEGRSHVGDAYEEVIFGV